MNVTTINKSEAAIFGMTASAADELVATMIRNCTTSLIVTFNHGCLSVFDEETGDELRALNDSADFNALWKKIAGYCVAYNARDLDGDQRHFLIEASNVPKDVTGDSIPDDERPSRVHDGWLATAVDSDWPEAAPPKRPTPPPSDGENIDDGWDRPSVAA